MAIDVTELQEIVGNDTRLPHDFDSYYDKEADVLYVTFEPGPSDDSDFTPESVVLRYREGRLISVTLLNASKRGIQLDDR